MSQPGNPRVLQCISPVDGTVYVERELADSSSISAEAVPRHHCTAYSVYSWLSARQTDEDTVRRPGPSVPRGALKLTFTFQYALPRYVRWLACSAIFTFELNMLVAEAKH